jgi:hypothetical protein
MLLFSNDADMCKMRLVNRSFRAIVDAYRRERVQRTLKTFSDYLLSDDGCFLGATRTIDEERERGIRPTAKQDNEAFAACFLEFAKKPIVQRIHMAAAERVCDIANALIAFLTDNEARKSVIHEIFLGPSSREEWSGELIHKNIFDLRRGIRPFVELIEYIYDQHALLYELVEPERHGAHLARKENDVRLGIPESRESRRQQILVSE